MWNIILILLGIIGIAIILLVACVNTCILIWVIKSKDLSKVSGSTRSFIILMSICGFVAVYYAACNVLNYCFGLDLPLTRLSLW